MGSEGVTSTRATPASIARLGAGLKMKNAPRATRAAMRRFMECQETRADLPAAPAPRQARRLAFPMFQFPLEFLPWITRGRRADDRSADFQSAVSPISNRQSVPTPYPLEISRRLRVANPRYSRLEICAT